MNFWIVALILVFGGLLYKRRLKAAITIAVLALGFYAIFPFGSWSYKLTLVVETPEGLKTGSAVRRVYASGEPKILPEQSGLHTSVKGEAVVVDLGERGVLFALLKSKEIGSDYGYYIVYQEFPSEPGALRKIFHYTFLKASKQLAFDKLPMLVRFRDINDPKTVEQVDPNDLEKSFGEGVKLVSATLEMTDEDMTTGVVEKLLPWIKNPDIRQFDGQKFETANTSNRFANSINKGYFAVGTGARK